MVKMASTPSSGAFLRKFGFLPLFFVVFIAILCWVVLLLNYE